MTDLRTVAQQVLGVLIDAQLHNYALRHDCTDALIVSLRAALAQQAEPVTNEEVIRIAREAGLGWDEKYHWYVGSESLARFAHLIRTRGQA